MCVGVFLVSGHRQGGGKFRVVKGETSLCVNTVFSQAKGENVHNWEVLKGRIIAFKRIWKRCVMDK